MPGLTQRPGRAVQDRSGQSSSCISSRSALRQNCLASSSLSRGTNSLDVCPNAFVIRCTSAFVNRPRRCSLSTIFSPIRGFGGRFWGTMRRFLHFHHREVGRVRGEQIGAAPAEIVRHWPSMISAYTETCHPARCGVGRSQCPPPDPLPDFFPETDETTHRPPNPNPQEGTTCGTVVGADVGEGRFVSRAARRRDQQVRPSASPRCRRSRGATHARPTPHHSVAASRTSLGRARPTPRGTRRGRLRAQQPLAAIDSILARANRPICPHVPVLAKRQDEGLNLSRGAVREVALRNQRW